MYRLSDYQYTLGSGYIAQTPAVPTDSSKLLTPSGTAIHDYHFYDLPKILTKKDTLFFNDTKVVKARVPLQDTFVEIPHHTSASRLVEQGEIFFLQLHDLSRFEGLITLTKRVRKGSKIHYSKNIILTVEELTDKGVLFHIEGVDVLSFFEKYGQLPLPPYITHTQEKEDHYQTIFAQTLGSVAAPTASLHFTPCVMDALKAKNITTHYLTLHIGLGTFKPVDTDDIRDYHIHEETIIVDEHIFDTVAEEKKAGKNILAIGTTVARTLETLPYLYKAIGKIGNEYFDSIAQTITPEESQRYILSRRVEGTKIVCETKIFIYPGFEWKVVDGMVTNFHLPGSTLLMLVASFVGYETVMHIYQHAIQHHYRFFSFGDAMLLRKK